MKKLEGLTEQLGGISREKALLIVLDKFGQKHKVQVPKGPIPYPYIKKLDNWAGRNKERYGVGLFVPKERENSWLTSLITTLGGPPVVGMVRRAIEEYELS